MKIRLLGGPHDGQRPDLTETPPQISVGGVLYAQVTDPDTGEFLGGYVVEGEVI